LNDIGQVTRRLNSDESLFKLGGYPVGRPTHFDLPLAEISGKGGSTIADAAKPGQWA
jgi:hypothetical protein